MWPFVPVGWREFLCAAEFALRYIIYCNKARAVRCGGETYSLHLPLTLGGHRYPQKVTYCGQPNCVRAVCALFIQSPGQKDFSLDFAFPEEMKAGATILLKMTPVLFCFSNTGYSIPTLNLICFTFVTFLWHFQTCNWAMACRSG